MKEKLLAVSVALSVLASAAALASMLSVRAQASAQSSDTGLKVIGEDSVTRVYSFRNESRLCFVATTRGGSGISITCP